MQEQTTEQHIEERLSKPTSAKGRLQREVFKLLRKHYLRGELPTSNRFLYYELVQSGVLDKTKTRAKGRGADQDLSDASKRLRDEGLVPWEWIVDETRSLTEWQFGSSVADYLAQSLAEARIDCWDGQPPPLLICESRTFAGVLERGLAAEFLCPVTATNGQVGGFLHTDVAPVLRGNGRPVLYVGDWDERGAMIEANTRRVLVQAAGERIWRRVALTRAQVDEYELPVIEKYDKVLKRHGLAVEVEALGQGAVTALVREAIEGLLPEPLADVRLREQAQRDEWEDRLDA
jgi:hypothetical protein